MNDTQKNLYSREICSLGLSTMNKLNKLNIIIYGMRGVGIETAKNIILSGPLSVTIYDPNLVSLNDLGSNFYLRKDDIGKRRDISVLERIKKLNKFVHINVLSKDINSKDYDKIFLESIINFDVIVITEILEKNLLFEIDEKCRNYNKAFIYGNITGLSGFIFSDFGKEHIIYDKNGKKCKKYYCKNIEKSERGLVTVDTSLEYFSLYKGDYVIFKNIKGMEELNSSEPKMIDEVTKNSFCIGNTINYGNYISGGEIREIKIPEKYSYKSMKYRFSKPIEENEEFNTINFEKEGRNGFLFIIFLALHDFYSDNKQLPEINNIEHSKILIEIAKKYYYEFEKKNESWFSMVQIFDEKIVSYVSFWARCEIAPLCSFLGAVLCQEIIKFTGKYKPINQWYFFDYFEMIETLNLNNNFIKRDILSSSRYDEQISIFGNDVQDKLAKLNIFMPGVGAIGCEILKNMALMGISTGKNSKFTITDYDLIELSNLSRQFLFQNEHIGLSKSEIAKKAIKESNNEFNCDSYTFNIGYESEEKLGDDFFEKQDLLISAVDSNKARKYLDTKSIQLNKILINSGTLGPISKYDLIIPNLTCCFHDFPELPKKEFGLCTIRMFPSQIDHCVQWAKIYFTENIVNIISTIKDILLNSQKYINEINNLDESENELNKKYYLIEFFLDIVISQNIEYLFELVIYEFMELFNLNIKEIIKDHPLDSLDQQGNIFWNGNKLAPHPIDISLKDKMSFNFIKYYIEILAKCLLSKNIDIDLSLDKINKVLNSKNNSIRRKNYSNLESKNRLNEKINIFIDKKLIIKDFDFEFDKLDDICIKFITSCSNLRARNYNIEECDEDKISYIILNIQPSLITSSAAISGLLSMQIFGLIQKSSLKNCLNGFLSLINLHLNLYKPIGPKKICSGEKDLFLNLEIKAIPNDFSVWDKIIINESKTIGQFLEYFKNKYNVELNYMSINEEEIYYKRKRKKINPLKEEYEKDLMSQKIEYIYSKKTKKDLNKIKNIFISVSGRFGNYIVKMPLIHYKIDK